MDVFSKESTEEIRTYLWTLELLSEALSDNDDRQCSLPEPPLTVRNVAGIHGAMRIISRLAGERCSEMIEGLEGEAEA